MSRRSLTVAVGIFGAEENAAGGCIEFGHVVENVGDVARAAAPVGGRRQEHAKLVDLKQDCRLPVDRRQQTCAGGDLVAAEIVGEPGFDEEFATASGDWSTTARNCGLPTDELVPLAEEVAVEVPGGLVRTALDLELADGAVVADRVGETPCVFLAGIHRAERTIAEQLMRLANGILPWPWIDPEKALPWSSNASGFPGGKPDRSDPAGATSRRCWSSPAAQG